LLWFQGSDEVTRWTPSPGPLFENRFFLDDSWLLNEFYLARGEGRKFAAYYHSHPHALRVEASRKDCEGHPPGSQFLVICPRTASMTLFERSLKDEVKEVQSFHFSRGFS